MSKALTNTIEAVEEHIDSECVRFGRVVKALNSKGFGSLLVGLSLILILPTGAIPLVPAIVGVCIIIVSVQIVLGRSHPWFPERVMDVEFKFGKYDKAIKRSKYYAERIEKYFHPRLRFLNSGISKVIIAIACIILSSIIIAIGFIPFLPMLPGLAILFFGLGLVSHDGMLTGIGYAFVAISAAVIPMLFLYWI